MTTTTINIQVGQKWRTVTGNTVRIDSEFGIHGYQFSANYVGTKTGLTYFTADGVSLGRDDLAELLEEAPAPKIVTPVVSQYLLDSLDDEMTLAGLLGWQNYVRPSQITPTVSIYGTHIAERGHKLHSSVQMPSWRRSWHAAGSLVALCQISINPTDGGVAAHSETGPVIRAMYHEHPTKDHAIWFAMCRAAIAYLEAK